LEILFKIPSSPIPTFASQPFTVDLQNYTTSTTTLLQGNLVLADPNHALP